MTAGHRVPDDHAATTARTLAATPGLGREPSDAERARTLVARGRHAALATARDGHPYASLVGYAADATGAPVLLLSGLSDHTAHLDADPRASLLVTEPGAADPPAAGRVTLSGRVEPVPVGERDAAVELYRAAHPGAFWAGFADFRAVRLHVAAVRFIGGFARAARVTAAEYAAAEPDPLAPHAARIVAHMNDDHTDALVSLCRVLAGRSDTGWARMLHVDRYGFDVHAAPAEGDPPRAVRIAFPDRADTPDACRAAMVALVRGLPAH